MGRKTIRDSVRDKELNLLLNDGYVFDQAWKLATEKANEAEKKKKEHRRKKNAEYQWKYRFRKNYAEKQRNENTERVSITLNLLKGHLDILDTEAKELMSGPYFHGTIEDARQIVIVFLLSSLEDNQQKKLKEREKVIGGAQLFIESERKKGKTDIEIQTDIDSVISMSIDDIMNYQFKTAKISAE